MNRICAFIVALVLFICGQAYAQCPGGCCNGQCSLTYAAPEQNYAAPYDYAPATVEVVSYGYPQYRRSSYNASCQSCRPRNTRQNCCYGFICRIFGRCR